MMQKRRMLERATLTLPSASMKQAPTERQGNWSKPVVRDRAEWIAIKVPAIVPQELFDKVQELLQRTEKRYRQPDTHHLIAGSDPVR